VNTVPKRMDIFHGCTAYYGAFAAQITSLALAALAGFPEPAPAEDVFNNVTISGGTITKATLRSAKLHDPITRDGKVVIQTTDIIKGGTIESGDLVIGVATGGEVTVPTAGTVVDLQKDLVTIDALTGTRIVGAEVTDAKLNQVTVNGSTVDLSQEKVHLMHAELDAADVSKTTVPRSALVKPKSAPATAEEANIPLTGDYFLFKTEVETFRPSRGGPDVTAPKDSCFRVTNEKPDPNDSSRTFVEGTFVTGWFPHFLLPPYKCLGSDGLERKKISANISYEVPKEMITTERDRLRYGWTYGVMVAPFKYYPKERIFNAGASVGPYVGYRVRDRPGDSSVVALSVGLANATLKQENADGTTSSSTVTGVSIALAYLGTLKDQFNIGFLAGFDNFSKSDNVPNSGKLWLGVSLGLKLN
jgi:hypothetical protein